MIGSCPMDSTNDDDSVAALCHRRMDTESSHHQYSYLMDIPVLSLATNRTYANIYCAQCHSDTRRLAPWNISVHCNDDYDKWFRISFSKRRKWKNNSKTIHFSVSTWPEIRCFSTKITTRVPGVGFYTEDMWPSVASWPSTSSTNPLII